MTLSQTRWQRTFALCALYFAQGIPWGFMLITLPSYLASNYAIDDGDIGKLKAIILIPWSFKLIWAPLIDSFTIRSMGRRRPWIIGAELMMAVTLLGFIGLGNPSEKLQLILWMYFIHNCFASLQDVCTDALAVDILPPHEQGITNGLMWGSKLVGKGLGAWGLSWLLNVGGIEACVAVQIVLLLSIMLIPVLCLERPGEKRLPWSQGRASEGQVSVRKPGAVFKAVLRAFSLTAMLAYVVFTLTKLIGVGINEVATNTLYIQHLSPPWTDYQYSTVSGLYALLPIIGGAVAGGWCADRFGQRRIACIGFGGYALSAMIYAGCPGLWNEYWFSAGYVLAYESLFAIGSASYLALAMRISWTTAAATVFTTYMTLSNVSHVIGNWLAGPVRQMFIFGDSPSATLRSYELTFWFVGVVGLLPLLSLIWVRKQAIDDARQREAAEGAGDGHD